MFIDKAKKPTTLSLPLYSGIIVGVARPPCCHKKRLDWLDVAVVCSLDVLEPQLQIRRCGI